MSFSTENPFVGPIPSSVQLPNAPLTAALIQIRFPDVHSIDKADFIAEFQECIRADYPLNHADHITGFELMKDNVKQTTEKNWRFLDKKKKWRLTLATNFIALETSAYKSHQDFIHRIVAVVNALSETIKPGVMTRIGVRYVNRIHSSQLKDITRFVRPEILGIYIKDYRSQFTQTLNQVNVTTDVGSMMSRWGYMPANQTHDLDLMPQIEKPSWFLDIDVFNNFAESQTFEVNEIEARAKKLAKRAYGFFRWTVSTEFLEDCGGEI